MPPFILHFLLFLPVYPSLVGAQRPVQTLFPAAIPLAVKTPYITLLDKVSPGRHFRVNVWHESMNTSAPLSFSSQYFWNLQVKPKEQATMGWAGKIRVNGTMYRWMGGDGDGTPTNVTNIQITPTRSIFVMQAGPINLTVTFLSPVEPDDWVKQSIPFSYVSVEAQSIDGNSYSMQIYSDITAEWASGDRSSQVRWSNTDTGSSIYHDIQLQSPKHDFSEFADQAQDGTVYYAMSTSQPRITWQIDSDKTTSNEFRTNGILRNSASTAFSSISPVYPVFAFAVDLGTIQSTASPVTWSVGYVRDPAVMYTTATGAIQQRRPCYVTEYANISNVVSIDAFTADFAGAHDRAVALDQKIMSAASQISSQYSDILSLGIRQTMGALDFTVGTDLSGHIVPSDVKIFMKNLGTDGRVNAVEHLFASFPMFLYLNASIGGPLLEPLLELQVSRTGVPYAAQDLGNHYPVAIGPTVAPTQGIEQSGNMLIMELAHARISGNGTLLSQYYNTTKRWADYLVNNALGSENQTNSDEGLASSVNIALKGVIGVKAMAEIAHAIGEYLDAAHYSNQSSTLLSSWLFLATSLSGSRLLGDYGDQQSWSLMYNLFADKLLGLDFVPQSVIDTQRKYLSSLLEATSQWGLPIDSSPGQTANAAWSLFASAFVSDTTLRDNLISSVFNHANSKQSIGAFPEKYSVADNSGTSGWAGPGLGGLFSHLVLTVPNKTISIGLPSSPSSPRGSGSDSERNGGSRSNHVGAIVGGVISGLAIVGITMAFFVARRKMRRQHREETENAEAVEQASHRSCSQILAPYSQDSATGFMRRSGGTKKGFNDLHELLFNRTQRSTPSESLTARPNTIVQRGPVSPSGDPPLPDASRSVSSMDMAGLHMEMQNLRQVVQDIQAERLQPPPEYVV
ncbi:hypothetical protein V8D89_011771 [Ganoderma adspersum]